jgi:hypothetical protein
VDWVSTEHSYHGEVPVEEMKRIRIKDDQVTSVENQVSTAASSPDAFRTSTLNTKQAAAEDQDRGSLGPWALNAKGLGTPKRIQRRTK